jgi:hypothetical protein
MVTLSTRLEFHLIRFYTLHSLFTSLYYHPGCGAGPPVDYYWKNTGLYGVNTDNLRDAINQYFLSPRKQYNILYNRCN